MKLLPRKFLLLVDVKYLELSRTPGLNILSWILLIKKCFFLLILAQKQTFDWISRSSKLPSPFESQFIARWAREKRHLGFRQVWAFVSAVSVPVLLQFTGSDKCIKIPLKISIYKSLQQSVILSEMPNVIWTFVCSRIAFSLRAALVSRLSSHQTDI
jgi:hypothetical protein